MVVTKLDFTYDGMDRPVLKKFDLDLPRGSRFAMIGGCRFKLWTELDKSVLPRVC